MFQVVTINDAATMLQWCHGGVFSSWWDKRHFRKRSATLHGSTTGGGGGKLAHFDRFGEL